MLEMPWAQALRLPLPLSRQVPILAFHSHQHDTPSSRALLGFSRKPKARDTFLLSFSKAAPLHVPERGSSGLLPMVVEPPGSPSCSIPGIFH